MPPSCVDRAGRGRPLEPAPRWCCLSPCRGLRGGLATWPGRGSLDFPWPQPVEGEDTGCWDRCVIFEHVCAECAGTCLAALQTYYTLIINPCRADGGHSAGSNRHPSGSASWTHLHTHAHTHAHIHACTCVRGWGGEDRAPVCSLLRDLLLSPKCSVDRPSGCAARSPACAWLCCALQRGWPTLPLRDTSLTDCTARDLLFF